MDGAHLRTFIIKDSYQRTVPNFNFVGVILSSIILTEYLSGLAHNSAQLIWMGLIFDHASKKVYIKLSVKFKLSRFATFRNNSEKHSEFLLCFRDMNFHPISLIF